MNNNFNANELDSTYGVIGELNTAFQLLGWAGAGSAKPASDLYNKIASEDSKLATTWKHSGEISGEISKIHIKIEELQVKLNLPITVTSLPDFNSL